MTSISPFFLMLLFVVAGAVNSSSKSPKDSDIERIVEGARIGESFVLKEQFGGLDDAEVAFENVRFGLSRPENAHLLDGLVFEKQPEDEAESDREFVQSTVREAVEAAKRKSGKESAKVSHRRKKRGFGKYAVAGLKLTGKTYQVVVSIVFLPLAIAVSGMYASICVPGGILLGCINAVCRCTGDSFFRRFWKPLKGGIKVSFIAGALVEYAFTWLFTAGHPLVK